MKKFIVGPICAAIRIRESVKWFHTAEGSSAAALAVTKCVEGDTTLRPIRLVTVLFNNKYYMKMTVKVKRNLKEFLSMFVVSSLVLKKSRFCGKYNAIPQERE